MKFYTASVRTVVKFRVAFELAHAANKRAAKDRQIRRRLNLARDLNENFYLNE